jgi:hypothetical protein
MKALHYLDLFCLLQMLFAAGSTTKPPQADVKDNNDTKRHAVAAEVGCRLAGIHC